MVRTSQYQELELAKMLREYKKPFTEFQEMVEEVLAPELLEQFEAAYDTVQFIKISEFDRVCTQCGATLHVGAREIHVLYHKQLTFSLWALQGFMLAKVAAAHGLISAEETAPKVKPKKKKGKKHAV